MTNMLLLINFVPLFKTHLNGVSSLVIHFVLAVRDDVTENLDKIAAKTTKNVHGNVLYFQRDDINLVCEWPLITSSNLS